MEWNIDITYRFHCHMAKNDNPLPWIIHYS